VVDRGGVPVRRSGRSVTGAAGMGSEDVPGEEPHPLQFAGGSPRLEMLRLAGEPSQRTFGVRSCHGGAPAAHGELGHRRSRPLTDPTTDERRTLMRPSRRRGGRPGVVQRLPPPRHEPTCACPRRRSAGTDPPGRPTHERRCQVGRPPDDASGSPPGSDPIDTPMRTRRADVAGGRYLHG